MFINKEIEKYITDNSTPEDPVLAELNRETHLKALNPRMISGHLQGKLLELISKMIRPENILEIGTFTGYSAICLAKGLTENGKLYSIEKNDELAGFQSKYIRKAALDDKIEILLGNATDIIPQLKTGFDLVFIDADKESYSVFYKLIIDKVRAGGIIIADNVLWNGKIVDENSKGDKDTLAIKNFNNLVQSDTRTENIILPIRDGISLIRKK